MIGATMNGAVSSDNAPRQLVPESVGMRNEVFLLTFGDVDKSSSVDSASSTYLELSDGISTVVTAETLEPDDDCSEVTVSDSPTRDDSTDRRCHFTVPSDLALDRKRSDSVYTPTVVSSSCTIYILYPHSVGISISPRVVNAHAVGR